MKDPIVDEIHKIREQIAKECNNDLKQIFKRIREDEKQHANRLVNKKDIPKAS